MQEKIQVRLNPSLSSQETIHENHMRANAWNPLYRLVSDKKLSVRAERGRIAGGSLSPVSLEHVLPERLDLLYVATFAVYGDTG